MRNEPLHNGNTNQEFKKKKWNPTNIYRKFSENLKSSSRHIKSNIIFGSFFQTHPSALITVTGSMASSVTRHPAPATGLAGMEPPPSSSVLVDSFTMKRHTHVTGLKM